MNEILELAPCGILEFTENGRITFANRYLGTMLGYTPEELLSFSVEQIFTMATRIFHQTHLMPLLRLHGKADEVFLTLRTKGDESVPVLTNATRRNTSGAGHILCVFMPVHQRRRYEDEILAARQKAEDALKSNEELQRSRQELEQRLRELDRNLVDLERKNAEITRLSEIVSHDLREPVRKIGIFEEIIREESQDRLSENGKDAFRRIVAGCVRIQEILRCLQEFLLVTRPKGEPELVQLSEIIKAARRRVNVELTLKVDELPAIEGYSEQLFTLFEIMLRNAWERRDPGGVMVRISGVPVQHNIYRKISGKYHYSEFLQITCTDNGRGFELEDCGPLFQLFWRGSNQQTPNPGLAICRKIAENHDGFISLQSPSAKGATFKIVLPTRQSANPSDSKSPADSL